MKFIDDLIEAYKRGEVTLPKNLFGRLYLLPFNNYLTQDLKPSAPKRWNDDLLLKLIVEVDKLRTMVNPRTKRKFNIDDACFILRGTDLFTGLKPTKKTYYKAKRLDEI